MQNANLALVVKCEAGLLDSLLARHDMRLSYRAEASLLRCSLPQLRTARACAKASSATADIKSRPAQRSASKLAPPCPRLLCGQVTPQAWHPSRAQMDRAEVMSPSNEPRGLQEVLRRGLVWKLFTCAGPSLSRWPAGLPQLCRSPRTLPCRLANVIRNILRVKVRLKHFPCFNAKRSLSGSEWASPVCRTLSSGACGTPCGSGTCNSPLT